jgi:hypothetical protein
MRISFRACFVFEAIGRWGRLKHMRDQQESCKRGARVFIIRRSCTKSAVTNEYVVGMSGF